MDTPEFGSPRLPGHPADVRRRRPVPAGSWGPVQLTRSRQEPGVPDTPGAAGAAPAPPPPPGPGSSRPYQAQVSGSVNDHGHVLPRCRHGSARHGPGFKVRCWGAARAPAPARPPGPAPPPAPSGHGRLQPRPRRRAQGPQLQL